MSNNAVAVVDRMPQLADSVPTWLERLEEQRSAGTAHFFVLHFNVSDYVVDGIEPPYRLLPYLTRRLRRSGYDRIGVLSVSTGLRWVHGGPPGASLAGAIPPSPPDAIDALRRLEAELYHADLERIAVILENLEYLAPQATGRDAAIATEILTRLAVDDGIRASGSIVVGLCHALESVAPALVEATGGVMPIKVPLPGPGDRERFLRLLDSPGHAVGLVSLEPGLSLEALINLSQGVTLAGLDALNRTARVSGEPISYRRVRSYKSELIERQSKGMLQELEPRHGFDAIGGLGHVVEYLRSVVAHVRERRLEFVPKGVLFSGPPGTGKTMIAEALAKEAGFNLVRMGDVRSMWVGESERNLSHVLRLLLELAPVVVFVDEVDQALGARERGYSGDSGVSARIFGRILNFMGKNEHRGHVVWIAATNRPDLLDEAMIRRFDRVFPFFLPGPCEREKIFRAMPKIAGVQYDAEISFEDAVARTEGLSGSALETIVRRAMELRAGGAVGEQDLLEAAGDYKPNHDPATYLFQSLLALNAANLFSSLPDDEHLPADIREVVLEMRRLGSATPLHARLRNLRCGGVRALD